MEAGRLRIRRATVEDATAIVRLGHRMFPSMGFTDADGVEVTEAACEADLVGAIQTGRRRGWVAGMPARTVASSEGPVVDSTRPGRAAWAARLGPSWTCGLIPPAAGTGRRQDTEPNRGSGIVECIQSVRISIAALHVTETGRSLHAEEGFADSNEMRARL